MRFLECPTEPMSNNPTSKQLIINADDFGWDDDTCNATIECFEAGSITSATIMTGRPATEMACKYAAANAHRFSFGLHFNIVDQHIPLSENLESLIDSTTLSFRDSNEQRWRALGWQLKSIDLQNELRAQINFLTKRGVKVSHVDSHGHLHKFPCVITALKDVLYQYEIRRVRRPQNLYGPSAKLATKIINRMSSRFFGSLSVTDFFLTVNSYETNWFNHLLTLLPNGVTELAVHPGYLEEWRRKEKQPLIGETFGIILRKSNTSLTNYYQI